MVATDLDNWSFARSVADLFYACYELSLLWTVARELTSHNVEWLPNFPEECSDIFDGLTSGLVLLASVSRKKTV